MPDVLKATNLTSRRDERERTSARYPQHGQALPEVDPSATPPALRPHPVWMRQLLDTFAQQRRVSICTLAHRSVWAEERRRTLIAPAGGSLVLQNLRSGPAPAATISGLPGPADSSGWENVCWPRRSTSSAPLQPTRKNLRQCVLQSVRLPLSG